MELVARILFKFCNKFQFLPDGETGGVLVQLQVVWTVHDGCDRDAGLHLDHDHPGAGGHVVMLWSPVTH